jgi:hypothetical protein
MNLRRLKARNRKCRPKTVVIVLCPVSFRAFSAKKVQPVPPGPMAQAITFRALGAESRSFETDFLAFRTSPIPLSFLRLGLRKKDLRAAFPERLSLSALCGGKAAVGGVTNYLPVDCLDTNKVRLLHYAVFLHHSRFANTKEPN